jgi:3-hydroxyacyl-[acyl-carrier-protein] dehydratase
MDLGAVVADKEQIHKLIAHRGSMSLLDDLVFADLEHMRGIARHLVREDEMWVDGHFPGYSIMPGVLQVEAAAQLLCYLFNARAGKQQLAAFLRIEKCVFRNSVHPGDTLYLMCKGLKFSPKRFVAATQGVLNPGTDEQKLAFEAELTGIVLR